MAFAAFGTWIGNKKSAVISVNQDADRALVLLCQEGDRKAQYELYQKYKDRVFNMAYRMSNNRHEAEDITQQVFVRIFNKIKSFRGDAAFSSWLYRLAANVCINHFHSEKRRKQRESSELNDAMDSGSKAMHGKDEKFNFKPFLEKAIAALPGGYKMVFVLYHIEGYNHKEIADMLNISEGTSKSQLYKARNELKKRLQPYLALDNSF